MHIMKKKVGRSPYFILFLWSNVIQVIIILNDLFNNNNILNEKTFDFFLIEKC